MSKTVILPRYAKVTLLLVGVYLMVEVLSIVRPIVLPIIYAILISILISPAVHWMVRKKINRTLSVAIVVFISLLAMSGIIVLLSSKVGQLMSSLPQLISKSKELFYMVMVSVSKYLNISTVELTVWLDNAKAELLANSGETIGITLVTTGTILMMFVLTTVYTFMILNYEPHLVTFIHRFFGILHDKSVTEMLGSIKSIIRRYVVGLFAEIAIVAVLNSIGLLIIGIEYAIIIGTMSAFLNIIPYFGGLVALTVFVIIALLTKPPIYMLFVIGLYFFIQFIDNNFLVPVIVGGNVKLNPLICILVIIMGAALWGIPGMFLSIPMAAIMKLIFDQVDSLKPWGFLMGDTNVPATPTQELQPIEVSKS